MTKQKLSIDEVKTIELEILQYINEFCQKHGLNYCVGYGTLLGAVRHQGFIPWDDDLDLIMLREDYDRFVELFNQEDTGPYRLLSHLTDPIYFNNFLKIIDTRTEIVDFRSQKTYSSGVFVDIFPFDRFDDMKAIERSYIYESLKLIDYSKKENVVAKDGFLKDLVRTGVWYLLRPIPPRVFAFWIDKECQKYTQKDGQYYGVIGSKMKEEDVFPVELFSDFVELPFEQIKVKAPKRYDDILKIMYGDYMQLPPEDQRTFPHEYDAYRVEG